MRKRTILLLALIGVLILASLVASLTGVRSLSILAGTAAFLLTALWIGAKVFRRFLWRVGRKLAFSYFLIGVLPIPMVTLLVGFAIYILSGSLVGHLFRDTAIALHRDVEETTRFAFERFRSGAEPAATQENVSLAYYRKGKKVAGDPAAPLDWPRWLVEPQGDEIGLARRVPFVLSKGKITMASAIEGDGLAVLGLHSGDLERELREHGGIWVELGPWEDRRVDVQVFGLNTQLNLPMRERQRTRRDQFFGTGNRELPLFDRPVLLWAEQLGSVRALLAAEGSDGAPMGGLLHATPTTVFQQVVSSGAELDAGAWGILLLAAFLLFDVYAAATLMALFLIYGLSRAVNRLSKATAAVGRGDFSYRIPVRRRDQLGELQRSYNDMVSSLEQLIVATAQKESLEKELQVARELQQSLLPSSLTTTEAVELASYFEPSAAIGGDYFDLLKVDDGRLVVVVADVSGHGLSAGLRMAMLKAALVMLVEQRLPAEDVFARLDRLVREGQSESGGRPLVTATLATFDPKDGTLELTNAGHTPTYWVHAEGVEEILLPSPPLGVLGDRYCKRTIKMRPGDCAVWLSDGLIEAADPEGEPFGFERVPEMLAGGGSATQVRDRLLAAVAKHSAGQPPADDRTLVVLRYLPRARV